MGKKSSVVAPMYVRSICLQNGLLHPYIAKKKSLRDLEEKAFFIAKGGGGAAKNTKMKCWKITRPDLRTTLRANV